MPVSSLYSRRVADLSPSRCPRLVIGLLLCFAAAQVSAKAEALERDLGEGLQFFRAHILPADLPSDKAKRGPLVLDLRYTLAETDAVKALDAWLKFRASEHTPVFVLFNSDTALSLRDLVASADGRPGLITLGRPAATVVPDIVVDCPAEEERKAYDALEKAASTDVVLRENTDKPRVDEASIMHARSEQTTALTESATAAHVDAPEKNATPAPPAPIDRPLQRAVQLHRALVALKRI